jgi:hypothetical protein
MGPMILHAFTACDYKKVIQKDFVNSVDIFKTCLVWKNKISGSRNP